MYTNFFIYIFYASLNKYCKYSALFITFNSIININIITAAGGAEPVQRADCPAAVLPGPAAATSAAAATACQQTPSDPGQHVSQLQSTKHLQASSSVLDYIVIGIVSSAWLLMIVTAPVEDCPLIVSLIAVYSYETQSSVYIVTVR